MRTKPISAVTLATIYGITPRSVNRWLRAGAPLGYWFDMPAWYRSLTTSAQGKLAPKMVNTIRVLADLRRWPKEGSAQINLWIDAAQDALARGQPIDPIPESVLQFFDTPAGRKCLGEAPSGAPS